LASLMEDMGMDGGDFWARTDSMDDKWVKYIIETIRFSLKNTTIY
jgi:hypothetical protein